MQGWSLLSNHGRLLVAITHDNNATMRELADAVGIRERSAHRLVSDLEEAGYISRRREGARNRYSIRTDIPVNDPLLANHWLGEILAAAAGTNAWEEESRRRLPGREPDRRRADRRERGG